MRDPLSDAAARLRREGTVGNIKQGESSPTSRIEGMLRTQTHEARADQVNRFEQTADCSSARSGHQENDLAVVRRVVNGCTCTFSAHTCEIVFGITCIRILELITSAL